MSVNRVPAGPKDRPDASDDSKTVQKPAKRTCLPVPRRPVILHTPINSETRLASRSVFVLDNLRLCRSWFAFVPSTLGKDKAVDAAVKAVIHAHNFFFLKDPAAKIAGSKAYGQAISLLRPRLSVNDITLLTVALLGLFETLMRGHPRVVYAHLQGIVTILKSRPRESPVSDLARAIFYANCDQLSRSSCAVGVPSPFDEQRWLELEPASRSGSVTSHVLTLRKIHNALSIRLPRLIAEVRRCRKAPGPASDLDRKGTMLLAHDLYRMYNDQAETAVLHQVHIVQTRDPVEREFMPSSYEFLALEDMAAALQYWQARLMTINLCLVLQKLRPASPSNPGDMFFDPEILSAAQARIAANVIMSWQDAFAADVLGTEMHQVLVVLWGALEETQTFRGQPAGHVRAWVLQRFRDLLAGWPVEVSVSVMHETSDLLAGGPIETSLAAAIK